MESSQPLPAQAVVKIRSFDGNQTCMDCRSPEPDWADVSHGTLVCIQCAGRHRVVGRLDAVAPDWLLGRRVLGHEFERSRVPPHPLQLLL